MAKELDSKFWSKYFKVYDVLNMVIPYQDLLNTIVKEADIKKGDVVLDAGCGTGNLSMKLKKAGAKVFGVDYCVEALNIYRQKDPKAEMLVHDLTKPLPFSDGYFNKIVCNNVIYALSPKSRVDAIKQFYKAMKPGGIIVISDPIPTTNPFTIYRSHVKSSVRQFGIIRTLRQSWKFAITTLIMFRYNAIILKASRPVFLDVKQRGKLLGDVGFVIEKTMDSYAGQASLIIGRKNA